MMMVDTGARTWKAVCRILLLGVLFCLFFHAPMTTRAASAEVHAGSSGDAAAVNRKEGDWVYSVYVDRDGMSYAAVTGFNGLALAITVPDTLGGYPVRSISRETFADNRYLTEVTLSEGIEDIGKYCFKGCVGIGQVSFPSTLRSVGDGAFYGCRSLTELTLPDGLNKLGDAAFFGCTHLRSAVLSASLQSIGDSAFAKCGQLEHITFGSALTSIGNEAFQDCASLQSAELPSEVATIGKGAFVNCGAMTQVSLGDTVEEILSDTFRGCRSLQNVSKGRRIRTIGASAFEGCESLDHIELNDNAESIGALAFYGCTGLKKATLGENIQNIGAGAFSGCTSLKQIEVSERNETFLSEGGALYSADGRRLLLCPQGAKDKIKLADTAAEIDDYAFRGCRSLTNVIFSPGVTKIGMGSFLSCTGITQYAIPGAVEKMGCLSVGYYFHEGALKKASYVNVFGETSSTSGALPETGSASELYCAAHDVRFRSFASTLVLNTEHAVLTEGESFEVVYGFLSPRKTKLSWTSSDESVVTVKNGTLHALKTGSAEVTVSAEGFDDKVIKVTVLNQPKERSAEKKYDTRLIYCGDSEELSSLLDQIIDPLFAVNKFWYSTNPKAVVVGDDGKVTAVGQGSANIVCRLPDGSESNFWNTVADRPTEFFVTPPTQELTVGQKLALARQTVPPKSTDTVTWKSENEDIASVDDRGVVTAIGQGSCEITATTASGLTDTVTVVCVIPAETLSLSVNTRSVYQGKEFNLSAAISEGSAERVMWHSSDPGVASVNSKGKVTGVSFGVATITAETAGGVSDSCVVNVMTRAEKLSLDVKKLTLNVGDTHPLHPLIFPSYSPETTEPCTWNSTDEAVASVDETGTITAHRAGSCIINCKTGSDLISKCRVTVRQPAQSADITGEKDTLYLGDVLTLHLRLTPTDTTDKVSWSSDDESVAKVSSQGSVRGKAAGNAVITATVTNEVSGAKITATYEIQVLMKAESIQLKKRSLSMNVGDTDSLLYTMTPVDSNDTVSWSSSDAQVASVREDGLITALHSGTCYVSVKTGSGCSDKCKIVVN
ncbi:MAG: leucine-rich repeat protein [Clostridia bacterium]|nr:leucine-rich repeat protein [Clostridia bacterium]